MNYGRAEGIVVVGGLVVVVVDLVVALLIGDVHVAVSWLLRYVASETA